MENTFLRLQKILEKYTGEKVTEYSTIDELFLDDVDLVFIEEDINKEFSVVLSRYKFYNVGSVDELVKLIEN